MRWNGEKERWNFYYEYTRERVMVLFSIVLRYRGLNEISVGWNSTAVARTGNVFKRVQRVTGVTERIRIRNSEATVVIFHTYV